MNGNWAFRYDTLNRLATAAGTQSPNPYPNLCWQYDGLGNRLYQYSATGAFASGNGGPNGCTITGTAGPTAWAAYSSGVNQMSSTSQTVASGQSLTYDAEGNIGNDGVNLYLYDGEGRICAVKRLVSGTMTQYLYDADGNRVAKGTITSWSCDNSLNGSGQPNNGFAAQTAYVVGQSGEQLSELSWNTSTASWQAVHTNVYASGSQIATYDADSSGQTAGWLYFHLTDWLGTRRQQTDYAGNPCLNFAGQPFGDELTPITIPNTNCADAAENHFTGKERDSESGNDYFGARYFASSMGRFLSPDPVLNSGRPENPQSWNRYSYAFNNPLKIVDPTGLYNLPANCYQDETCAQIATNLKNGLAALNKALDNLTDKQVEALGGVDAVARLSEGLAAMGTENDGNNVNVKLGALGGSAAMQTDPTYDSKTNSYSGFTVTIDPAKSSNTSAVGLAINGDHEGQHIWDFNNYMLDPAHTETLFQLEYRGYQNTSGAAQALKQDQWTIHTSHGDFQVWNSSWKAVDRQTMRDRGITSVVNDADHPETQPHNPNTP